MANCGHYVTKAELEKLIKAARNGALIAIGTPRS
jgi:hypothetical protein